MAAQTGDILPAKRGAIPGRITVQDILDLVPGGGGGSSPSLFYALSNQGGSSLGTSLGTLTWAAADFEDSGFSESGGVVTIGAALDGQRARIDWQIEATGATNRVELRSQLQVDTGGGFSVVKRAANYSARNSTQNEGGVSGFHLLTLATGMQIRVQALRQGSIANLHADGTSIAITTL